MSALLITTGGRASALPLHVLLSAIPSLPRHALNALVERAIERMDDDDGDPDLEANGDELDGTTAEDDYGAIGGGWRPSGWSGPGCPISDPDTGADDVTHYG